jgi:phytoene dehydrogenase-like protein
MDDTDVIVIGAGLAGLTCALELERSGVSVLLLEREPTPGGRLRTGELNGTPIDLGAHFLSHRYATLRRLIAEAGLEQRLRPLTDSYCTGIWRGGSWHYLDYGRPLSMLGYSAIPFSQRARLGMMAIPLAHTRRGLRFFDIASAAAVDGLAPARLFGEEGLRYVFAPASQAFCGYSPEQISLPLLVLGARFPLRAPLTLEGGLGQLGPALAAGQRVRCGIAVERLELNAGGGVRVRAHAHAHAHDGDGDGDELHFAARAAVIATTPSAALRLWPGAPQPERDFLASARYTQHFHVYLKTNRRFRPTSPHGAALYMQILPHGERPGVLSHMSFAGGGQGPEA